MGFLVALVFLFVLIINVNIVAKTNDNIYSVEELIKLDDDFDCIIILGAGVKANGSPTDMLRDRLIAGFEAYKHLKNYLDWSAVIAITAITSSLLHPRERSLIGLAKPWQIGPSAI